MKVLLLALLTATLGFGQTADCLNQAACEEALRANSKNSLAHFRLGEIYFRVANYQSAANHFSEALGGDLNPKDLEVWSHVNLGKCFDAVGSRQRAVNQYRKAQQTGDNTRGAMDESAKYLAEPFLRN